MEHDDIKKKHFFSFYLLTIFISIYIYRIFMYIFKEHLKNNNIIYIYNFPLKICLIHYF
jgi:hypothetical protein